jgi:formylglycine-generating enzyme
MRNYSIYPKEFPESWASEWGEDPFGLWMAFTYKGVRQIFRWIEPGTFEMGSPITEPERLENETQHNVTLSLGYWLADSTVTQALWQAVMNENPSYFKGKNRPVDNVSWDVVQNFIFRMNTMKPELKLCLPTEAQWEYACRAKNPTPFSFGSQIDSELVNFDGTNPYNNSKWSQYRQETVEVKNLPANDWGLYEMHGNVLEWCQDWYGDYSSQPMIDPQGLVSGVHRVLRGGSWFSYGKYCRSAYRNLLSPVIADNSVGFRLARAH